MAKVKLPFLSQRALGSVGCLTASESKQNATMRLRVSPTQPKTSSQLAVRAILAAVSALWQTASASQRSDWADYAANHPVTDTLGDTVYLSGHQWFTKCNALLGDAGFSAVLDCPITAAPAAPTNFAAADGVLQSSISWTALGGTDKTLQIWRQGPISAGVTPDIRKASVAAYQPGQTTPKVVTGLSPGRHVFWARTIDEDNGLASPYVSDEATITAT